MNQGYESGAIGATAPIEPSREQPRSGGRRTSSRYQTERVDPVDTSRRARLVLFLGRGLFAAGLLVAILFQGAVSPVPLTLACVLVGAAGVIASGVRRPGAAQRNAISIIVIVGCLLAAYLTFQAHSLPVHPFGSPIWDSVQSLLGFGDRAISVDPSATREAILPLLLPFAIYASGLALFSSDTAGLGLLRLVAAFGVAFAGFGLVQMVLLPDSLLLETKTAYLGSLTSVFVNRNTAGTFLGIAALACLTLLMRRVHLLPRTSGLGGFFHDPHVSDRMRMRLGVRLLSVCAVLLALVMTQSRGAIFSSAAAFALVVPLLILDMERRKPRLAIAKPVSRWRYLKVLAGVVVVIAILLGLFGSQALLRMAVRGFDPVRVCLYESSIAAFRDNWRFGTGFGTFDDVFPAHRDAECVFPKATFLRAHNFFLEGLMGLGIVFVPLAMAAYGFVLTVLWIGQTTRRRFRFVPIIGFGAVLLVTLHALVDFSLQIPGMSAYFSAYLAAVTTFCLGRAGEGSVRHT